VVRRVIEVAVALAGLVLTSPVVLLCAVLVRATSPGPAVFAQERVGRDMRPFRCLKMRTMWRDTAQVPTHQSGAGAVTPVGRFLRRTKLDELPQLWNVVAGDMSFVGPRPCLPTQADLIEARRVRGVYALRPGITGLAQVRGIDMSQPERLAEVDAEYLARRSPTLDLRILAATLVPCIAPP
jgi:O-antigen biosynthesis protein WbqP